MRKKMQGLRDEMNKTFPKLAERTVFTLNPTKTGHESWRLLVNDNKRADMATMYDFDKFFRIFNFSRYEFMNKDFEVMKNLQKKYKFLHDKSRVYQYEIDAENLSLTQIVDQFKNLDRQKLKEHFMTDDAPYWRVSNKLVGSTFHQNVTQNGDTDDAVFYYSKHCHGCKKFGPMFEQVARMSMGKSTEWIQNKFDGIKFSRINNSLNTIDGARNFGYTPVFTFYKKGYKQTPFILRPQYFGMGILEDFLTVTRDVQIMEHDVIDSAFNPDILQ